MQGKCWNCGKEIGGGIYYTRPGGQFGKICNDCNVKYPELYEDDSKKRKREELRDLKKKSKCRYELAWIGYCNQEGYPYCETHKDEMCSCGKKAIGQCDMAVSMVCGRPTCNLQGCHYHLKPDSIVW